MVDGADQLNGCQPVGKRYLASPPAFNGIGDGVEIPGKAARGVRHILQDGVDFRLAGSVPRHEILVVGSRRIGRRAALGGEMFIDKTHPRCVRGGAEGD